MCHVIRPLWQSVVAYRCDQRDTELLFHSVVVFFILEVNEYVGCSQWYCLFKKIPVLFEDEFMCVCFPICLSICSSVVYGWQSLSRWNSVLLWDSAQMLLTTYLSLQARNSNKMDSSLILHTGTYWWLQACDYRDHILLQPYSIAVPEWSQTWIQIYDVVLMHRRHTVEFLKRREYSSGMQCFKRKTDVIIR